METKEKIIESLVKLPELILVTEKNYLDSIKEVQDNKETVKAYEIAINNKVLSDSQTEEMKANLSNADKRGIEVKKRLNASDDYKTYCKVLEEKENRSNNIKLELEFLKRQFTAKHTILRAISGD